MAESLISAASGLVGATLGVVGSWFLARGQHRRDRQAEKERHDQQLLDEAARQRWEREVAAAEKIDRLFSYLSQEIPRLINTKLSDDAYQLLQEQVNTVLYDLEGEAAYLPRDTRDRVVEYRDLVREAEDLWHYHYSSWHSIIYRACRDSHEFLAAFLRSDLAPAESEWLEHSRMAMEELEEIKLDQFAHEIGEDDKRRTKWLEQHNNNPTPD